MKKCIVFVSTLIVLVGLLLVATYVLSQKSSTVEIDSKSDLPASNTSADYCETPACIVAASKLHVNYLIQIDETLINFYQSNRND